jgi:hypothetical protein
MLQLTPCEIPRLRPLLLLLLRCWHCLISLAAPSSTHPRPPSATTAGTLGNDTTAPAEALAYDGHGPSGLLNLTACYWGAPIYLSKPLCVRRVATGRVWFARAAVPTHAFHPAPDAPTPFPSRYSPPLSHRSFLDGSPSLHDGVIGLGAPDRSRHDTWLGVEPTAGA